MEETNDYKKIIEEVGELLKELQEKFQKDKQRTDFDRIIFYELMIKSSVLAAVKQHTFRDSN